jgi:hypothetical protein
MVRKKVWVVMDLVSTLAVTEDTTRERTKSSLTYSLNVCLCCICWTKSWGMLIEIEREGSKGKKLHIETVNFFWNFPYIVLSDGLKY